MKALAEMTRELRALRKGLDRMREELRAQATPVQALKRAEAAKAMGVSVGKLDGLIRDGKVRTTDDAHLIPMAEVRRYCAPKTKRKRRPAIGHRARRKLNIDTQSDEAWDEASKRLHEKAEAP